MTEKQPTALGELYQITSPGEWSYDPAGFVVVRPRGLVDWSPVVADCDVPERIANGKFCADVHNAFPELLAEVRRLRECLEFLADETKLSAEHHNSHLWAYIVGEALQVDPKESPFWEPDDEVSP